MFSDKTDLQRLETHSSFCNLSLQTICLLLLSELCEERHTGKEDRVTLLYCEVAVGVGALELWFCPNRVQLFI